jgi:acyl-CoA reductase-like NAD-dependent aldehyde dehydrogenase
MQRTHSPIDDSVYVEREQASAADVEAALVAAVAAQEEWRGTAVAERAAMLRSTLAYFEQHRAEIGREISCQMGRPIAYSPGEVGGLLERAEYMIELAPTALADIDVGKKEGFKRYIRREPLGVVAIVAPWNYPYLTACNGIFPALMAGNAVLLKHSSQTPLVAERFAEAMSLGGLPEGLFQYLHLSHQDTESLIADVRVAYVNFTGSVQAGHRIQGCIAGKFINAGLELGGKDPAYVRADADLAFAVENLVDGAFFNSGQSCCGIERIYVHADCYAAFVEQFCALTRQYKLGDSLDPEITLGPMVRASAADFVRGQIDEAVEAGARALIDAAEFPASKAGTPYLAPQVLVDVDHSMRVMTEESFGPVVGIMAVDSDEQALALMNDSEFGLTASIWSRDIDAALALGDRVETGTLFVNRCDYLDPALGWTGVKNSGRGCTLSTVGYEVLTRPKSFHARL